VSPLPDFLSVFLENLAFFATHSPFFSIFTDSFSIFVDNIYVKQLNNNTMFKKDNLIQTLGLIFTGIFIIPCLTMILVHVITNL